MTDFYKERTVKWEDGTVTLIDQMKLPNKFTYIHCKNHLQVAKSIKEMNIRGAPAIGVAAAMGLALVAYYSKTETKEELLEELKKASRDLLETRPTAVNLEWGLKKINDLASKFEGGIDSLKKSIIEEAKRMGDEDVEINKRMGNHGSVLLNDGDSVLTHCKWF